MRKVSREPGRKGCERERVLEGSLGIYRRESLD